MTDAGSRPRTVDHAVITPDGFTAWPVGIGAELTPPVWCRGAGGIAGVLDRVGHQRLAAEARRSVATALWTSPNRCHGAAGQVETLLDGGRRDRGWHDDARVLAHLMAGYVQPGSSADPARWRRWLEPDLLEGSAGVAMTLARVLHPEVTPWATRIFGPGRRAP